MDSVSKQTYSNHEHLIIDGGSTDGTIEIINNNFDDLSCFISESDNGIYDALNKGINKSTGDIIGFLHADDLYNTNEVLEKITKYFEDPNVAAVYGNLQYVRKDNINKIVRNWKSSKFNHQKLKWGWMPPHPTLYIRREWYQKIGNFDTKYQISADYFCMLQLFSRADFIAVYMPEVLVKMRLGGISNRSIRSVIKKTAEDFDALHRLNIGFFGTVLFKNLRKLKQFFVISPKK